ncbi:MAG TPA: outer membrane beta-barrel protein [Blastocatellia bacterium]|nr:outer membrane beta-barrel protein [Blastocatellia bacterium]
MGVKWGLQALIAIVLLTSVAMAQNSRAGADTREGSPGKSESTQGQQCSRPVPGLSDRELMLLDRIEKLERRVAELETRSEPVPVAAKVTVKAAVAETPAETNLTGTAATGSGDAPAAGRSDSSGASESQPGSSISRQVNKEDRSLLDFLRETTISVELDGYYGYNFNRPIGHINLLRAYDVSSNSFSLNQADVVIERAPDVQAGRRFGLRLDLQYGQATETLQGNPNNEPRPQVYRPVFQAYGTYVFPVGSGLQVDFGKWASALGFENNYTKDQINYSRSYFFNFLPFYHFGFRTSYNVSSKLNISYWVVNGIQQSEDFNGFKSQALLLNIKPSKSISWNVNYYTGIEGRDSVPALNPGFPSLPTQPGFPTIPVTPTPRGRLHIIDSYASWNITNKLTLAGEGDYVINRVQNYSPPKRVAGGAFYVQYQFTPKFSLAGRTEYLADRGGLFSGTTQDLKETTFTASYLLASGFMMKAEFRRDFSNIPFFLTNIQGILSKEQNTATLGMIWWIGRKEGSW